MGLFVLPEHKDHDNPTIDEYLVAVIENIELFRREQVKTPKEDHFYLLHCFAADSLKSAMELMTKPDNSTGE